MHFALPLRVSRDGSFGTVAQDSTPEILQTAAVLLGTSVGSRTALPEFGLRDPTFDIVPLTQTEVAAAVTLWDDRVRDVKIAVDVRGDTTIVNVMVREGE